MVADLMGGMEDYDAWNRFVMGSDPADHEPGSLLRAAALANLFMGAANNGGFNSFLDCTSEIDPSEVLGALRVIGARIAAEELAYILNGLGSALPTGSQEARLEALDRLWTDDLNEHDVLSRAADDELMRVLEEHVGQHRAYYLTLPPA